MASCMAIVHFTRRLDGTAPGEPGGLEDVKEVSDRLFADDLQTRSYVLDEQDACASNSLTTAACVPGEAAHAFQLRLRILSGMRCRSENVERGKARDRG